LAIKQASPFALTMVVAWLMAAVATSRRRAVRMGRLLHVAARSSYLEMGTDPKIVKTVNELLQQVHSRRLAH